MRLFATILLFFMTLAIAESQEDLYYKALKAEESGNIGEALKFFEAALVEPGPYTAEIQEIVNEYRDALGMPEKDSSESKASSAWEFHSSGKVGFYRLHYESDGDSVTEKGSMLSTSVNASLDYSTQHWLHSFELNASGNWFVDKKDMPSLDTSTWEGSFGLEYSAVGKSLVLDLGSDMNYSEEDGWSPDFFVWVEKYLALVGKHKFGTAFWAYDNLDGPLSTALYVSWHRFEKYGWRSGVYAGARFDADSIDYPEYWLKWLGPSLKPSFSYRFKTEISVDAKMNLFYGFVVDGPDADYEKVQKFSSSWGLSVSWMPRHFGVFLGVDQFYRYYVVPSGYSIAYSKETIFTEYKAGVKFNL